MRYFVFTSYNHGEHGLTEHATADGVVDEVEQQKEATATNVEGRYNKQHALHVALAKLKVGDNLSINFKDSTWKTVFKKEALHQ